MANSIASIFTNSGAASAISSGGTTCDNTLGLSGTANGPVKRVAIYDGSTFLGNATLKNGNWSFNTPALADGTHTLKAVFYGNSTTSASVQATIDTRPPALTFSSTLLTNAGTVPSISSGQSTVDGTLGLSGTAEAGSTVQVYDGNTLLGNATVASNGTWSFTTPNLAGGIHSFRAVARDAAGNQTTLNGPSATVLPLGTLSTTVATDTGSVASIVSGGVTRDKTLGLSGTVQSGVTVQIYDGNTLLGNATVAANGNWSYTTKALAEGAHTLKARFTRGADVLEQSLSATIDTQGPTATFASTLVTDWAGATSISSGQSTADKTLGLSGTVEAGGTVKVYDGNTLLGNATVAANGVWTYTTPNLALGSHAFKVVASDVAGNQTTVNGPSATVVLGTLNAALTTNTGSTASIASGGVTRDKTLGLSGTAQSDATVQIYDGSTLLGSAAVAANGTWSYTTPALTDATHTLKARITRGTDVLEQSLSAIVDTLGPAATFSSTLLTNVGPVTSISSGQSTVDKTLGLSGTVEAGSTVQVYDGSTLLGNATVAANGTWSYTTPTLAAGNHTFKAVASDAAGNQTTVSGPSANLLAALGTVSSTVGTDTGITASISAGGVTKDKTPTISGTAAAGVSVNVYDGNTLLGPATVAANGTWSYTTPELTDGNHTLKARFAVGNETYDASIAVAVDTVADGGYAFLRDLSPVGRTTGGIDPNQPFIGDRFMLSLYDTSGPVTTSNTVRILDNGQFIGNAYTPIEGYYWHFDTPSLTPGVHRFTAQVVDPAGNVAEIQGHTVNVVTGIVSDTITTSSGATASIANGGATRDDTPGFSGAAVPGAQITVFEGQRQLATTTAGADGTWSLVTPHLADGTHNFRFEYAKNGVTQVDTHSLSALIDTSAPNGAFQTVTPGVTQCVVNNPVLTGTVEAGAQVFVYDGNTLLGTASRNGTNWQYEAHTLNLGAHNFKARLVDAAGNEAWVAGPSMNLLGYVDPAIVTDSGHSANVQSGGITSDNTLTFTGTAAAGAVVRVYDGSAVLGTASPASNAGWSFTTRALADGLHNFHIDVSAGGQQASSAEMAVTVDRVAPTTAATLAGTILTNLGDTQTIQSGGRTADHTLGLSGTAQANEYVKVFDGSTLLGTARVDATGHWDFVTPALHSGAHSFKAMVVDAAGNEGPSYSNTLTAQVNAAPALPAIDHPWSVESGWGEIDALAALRAATGRALPDVLNTPRLGDYLNDGVVQSNMEDAHYYGYTGAGVTVAVIDTGFSSEQQPALAQTKLSPWAWDFANNDPVPEDVDDHGTFVASQIVARGDLIGDSRDYGFAGGAYGVELMPLRIAYDGDSTTLFQAMHHAVDHGADIINLSLLVGSNDIPAMRSNIQYAKDHNVLVVVSAGNDPNGNSPYYPAAFAKEFDNVIAVGFTDGHTYANYGNDAGAGPYAYVDASGLNTLGYVRTGSLTWWHGSSFSAPLVTAEAALLHEANPLLSASQIADLITHTTHGISSWVMGA